MLNLNLTKAIKGDRSLLMEMASTKARNTKAVPEKKAFAYRPHGGLNWINMVVTNVKDYIKDVAVEDSNDITLRM